MRTSCMQSASASQLLRRRFRAATAVVSAACVASSVPVRRRLRFGVPAGSRTVGSGLSRFPTSGRRAPSGGGRYLAERWSSFSTHSPPEHLPVSLLPNHSLTQPAASRSRLAQRSPMGPGCLHVRQRVGGSGQIVGHARTRKSLVPTSPPWHRPLHVGDVQGSAGCPPAASCLHQRPEA